MPLRLLALALLLTSCSGAPTAPNELVALGNVRNTATAEAAVAQATALPITQLAVQTQASNDATQTFIPPALTKAAQEIALTDIAITQAWDDATATAVIRQTEAYTRGVELMLTNNEAARRDIDNRLIYDEQQRQREFDAWFWPLFWRGFWIALVLSLLIIALWIGKATQKKISADADSKQTKAQAEADATRIIAAADARKKRAEARRLEMIPVSDGVYYPNREGGYDFLEMHKLIRPVAPTLPPVPPMRGEPVRTYPKITADVLDFLDACAPLMRDDPRKLPSAEALNNSTLRDNGLKPLLQAGAAHTMGGRNGGTFILGYASIGELRAAVEAGQVPLPDAAEVMTE